MTTIKELPVLYPKTLLKQDEISNNFLNYKDDAFISILENYGTKTKDIVEDYIENAINQIEIFLRNKSVIKDDEFKKLSLMKILGQDYDNLFNVELNTEYLNFTSN